MHNLQRAGFMRYAKRDLIIGIDPDIDKSGVAILDARTDDIKLASYTFVEMAGFFHQIKDLQQRENLSVQIYIEYSASTRHNWHLAHYSEKKSVASAKGYNLGQNHQVEQCLYDYAKDFVGLDIVRQPPFKKCWKGKDRKITHEEITSFMPIKDKSTNQEKRDAALLAWLGAGRPIVIKNK